MTNPKLSPAAQAVLDAAINVAESPNAEAIVSAAIHELKNQVAPHRPTPQTPMEWGEYNMTEIIREKLDAIAAELERWGK